MPPPPFHHRNPSQPLAMSSILAKTPSTPIHTPQSRRALAEVANVNPAARTTTTPLKSSLQRPRSWVHGSKVARRRSAFDVFADGAPAQQHVEFTDPPTPQIPDDVQDSELEELPEEPRRLRRTTSLPYTNPASLSHLLLSHATPHHRHKPIPTPPRSTSAHTPLAAATSLPSPPPPTPPHSPDSQTPLELLRALRAQLSTAPPKPARKPQPQAVVEARAPAAVHHGFTLAHLPPLTHHTAHSIITLHPPTHLTLVLRAPEHGGSHTRYTITANAGPVTVTNRLINKSERFALADLPWKHLPAYRYARRFVRAVQERTVLAYGGIEGAEGRVWADGRGEVVVDGIEVAVGAAGEVRGVDRDVADRAKEVWGWLRGAPKPVFKMEGEWEVDRESVFVRGVGWCRDLGGDGWEMRFLDGVEMGVRGDGRVEWRERGRSKVLVRGMEEGEVRRRVAAFVKAGL